MDYCQGCELCSCCKWRWDIVIANNNKQTSMAIRKCLHRKENGIKQAVPAVTPARGSMRFHKAAS